MSENLIGLDVGTTGGKSCVFDLDGNLISSHYEEYPIITDPENPGLVEQDMDLVTEKLFSIVKQSIEKADIDRNNIKALGLSTQGASIIYCDEEGRPIGNGIIWQDMRGFEVTKELEKGMSILSYMKEAFTPQVGYSTLAKQIWMNKFKPDVVKKAAHVANFQEYILRQFGAAEWLTDAASTTRESTGSLKNHYYSEKIYKAYGLDMSKRGKRVDNGTVACEVSKEISEKTGLPVGCKICVGAMDQTCSPFGCGMYKEGDTVVTIGTIGCSYVCTEKLAYIPGSTLNWKSHMYFENGMKNYTAEVMTFAAASAYKWLRDTICTQEAIHSLNENKDVYEILNDAIKASAPGAHGVTFLPFLAGRSYCPPDEFATGSYNGNLSTATFTGMRMATRREDLVRAVAEGILYDTREQLAILEENGLTPGDIVVNGGVTKSPYWCQMMADIWGRPVTTTASPEPGCLGAAMFAGIGVGLYKDPEDAVKKAVRYGATYTPDTTYKDKYDEGFEQFKRTFNAVEESTGKKVKAPLVQRLFLAPYVFLYGRQVRNKYRKSRMA